MARHVRKGDQVIITSGSHKGKTGTVVRVMSGEGPGGGYVVIKGVNLRTKHIKPNRLNAQGGIVTREAPIHISNVSPVDGAGKATRVRFQSKPDGSKVRLAATDGRTLGEPLRSAEAKKHVSGRKPVAGKAAKPAKGSKG